MGTRTVDERLLLDSGFHLIARNLGWSQETLWRRDDQPDRSFTDSEAIAYLDEQNDKEKR